MTELYNVNFNWDGSFNMHMANGNVRVPAQPGCYAVSTGCGSGKTECAKSIIRQCSQGGVLYCVNSVEELHKMHTWIRFNQNELGLSHDDFVMLDCTPECQDAMKAYRDNPQMLVSKKVILITHVRFWTDLINYFLIYNPQASVTSFDGDFNSLLQRPDLRKFIIFDETPTFVKPFFEIPRPLLCGLGYYNGNNDWTPYPPDIIRENYNQFIKGHPADPFPKGDQRIDQIKREVIFNLIPRYFNQWKNEKSKVHSITFSPINLYQPTVKTHILILEGAANVLFQKSQYFKILDIPKKYNGNVIFKSFPFQLKRRTDMIDKAAYRESFGNVLDGLKYCNDYGQKSLVAVWKSHGKNNNDTGDSAFYEKVKLDLAKYDVPSVSYDVIYYGSPQSKSTNQFKDYDNIFLCGDWNITNEETSRFNRNFGVTLTSKDLKLWTFIQLICRINIRMHNGRECHVYYSSDFDSVFIQLLDDYFQNLDTFLNRNPQISPYPEWLEEKLSCVRKDYWEDIANLVEWDSSIETAIKDGTAENIEVKFEELLKVIPRKNRKKREYRNLRIVLDTIFNIKLNFV